MREILADHVPMSAAAAARCTRVGRQSFAAMFAVSRPVMADMALTAANSIHNLVAAETDLSIS
jgi:hypothetical protein